MRSKNDKAEKMILCSSAQQSRVIRLLIRTFIDDDDEEKEEEESALCAYERTYVRTHVRTSKYIFTRMCGGRPHDLLFRFDIRAAG